MYSRAGDIVMLLSYPVAGTEMVTLVLYLPANFNLYDGVEGQILLS